MDESTTTQGLVGRNVRDLRRAAGMTQAELGRAMSECFGFRWETEQAVAQAEKGKRRFQLDELLALAAFFGVTPMSLLVAPGSLLPPIDVITNGRRLSMNEYAAWWGGDKLKLQPVAEEVARDRRCERPWAKGKADEDLPSEYEQARQQRLASRPSTAYPGPIVGSTQPQVEVSTTVPPWSQGVRIMVPDEGTYVARDDIERDALLHELQQPNPKLRAVDRRKKYEAKRGPRRKAGE